jgi:hypothetical protein
MSESGDETRVDLILAPVSEWTIQATNLANSGKPEERAAAPIYAQAALARAIAALAAAHHNQQ